MTTHAAQVLVANGYATSNKAMDATVARIARVHIFPKVKFTVESDFSTEGRLFKVCCRKYVKGSGGSKEQFKEHWVKNNGWKIARQTINSKRNSVQDSIRKHAKKCKELVFAYSFYCQCISHNMTYSYMILICGSAEWKREASLGPNKRK